MTVMKVTCQDRTDLSSEQRPVIFNGCNVYGFIAWPCLR